MNIGDLIASVELEVIAHPRPGETVERLVEILREEGKEIVEVREDGVVILIQAGVPSGGQDN